MSYLKITHYLKTLLMEGRKWEFTDLLNSDNITTYKKAKTHLWVKRLLLLIPTLLIYRTLKNNIDQNAIGYGIAALSIFIGLFANLIITMYTRFLNIPNLKGVATSLQLLENKKVKNFIRQFTFVTGKNLFVATLMIALMLLILIFPGYMSININSLEFIKSAKDISAENLFLGVNGFIATFLHLLLIYLTFDFFLSLLYSLGALFTFLKREYK